MYHRTLLRFPEASSTGNTTATIFPNRLQAATKHCPMIVIGRPVGFCDGIFSGEKTFTFPAHPVTINTFSSLSTWKKQALVYPQGFFWDSDPKNPPQ